MIASTLRMKLKYDFHMVEIGDSIMAVAVGDSALACKRVLSCNETAAAILDLLKQPMTEQQIVAELTKQYQADERVIEEHVYPFINQLKENDLLELDAMDETL